MLLLLEGFAMTASPAATGAGPPLVVVLTCRQVLDLQASAAHAA